MLSTGERREASERSECDRLFILGGVVMVEREVINSCIDNIRLSSGLLCEELQDILKM